MACLLVCLAHGRSHAQDVVFKGYALNILDAAQRGSEWFASESLDLRGHARTSFGFGYDWSHRPFVVDGPRRAVVRNQMIVQPGASVILWERLRLALDIPMLVYSDGNTVVRRGIRYEAPPGDIALADIRLGAVVRLFGTHSGPLTAALGVHVMLPTGKENAYTGDGAVRAMPQLLLAGDYNGFTYAGKLGLGLSAATHYILGAQQGNYAYFALSMGVRMFERRFVLGPELFGYTGLGHGEMWKRRTTPVEALLGMHYSFDNGMRLGVGIGFGLTDAFGAPEQRGLASLEWNAPLQAAPLMAAEQDSDWDGVPDREDACSDRPGPRSPDVMISGCPRVGDSDGDSIRDDRDACPEHSGPASDDSEMNGCPKPKDADRDGVADAYDACPDQAGEATADPQTTGCRALVHEDTE
ncbi:MAG TPA: transporter [Polyangiales bacterium]|nr:transporter [Polyangiales bacterium]